MKLAQSPALLPFSLSPANLSAFGINTYEICARNPFRIRTCKSLDLKSFRIRTYKKTRGVGVLLLTKYPDICPERPKTVERPSLGIRRAPNRRQDGGHALRQAGRALRLPSGRQGRQAATFTCERQTEKRIPHRHPRKARLGSG
jgi:hypothetical protein